MFEWFENPALFNWYQRRRNRNRRMAIDARTKLVRAWRPMGLLAEAVVPGAVVFLFGSLHQLFGARIVVAGMTDGDRLALQTAPGLLDAMKEELREAGLSSEEIAQIKFQYRSDEIDNFFKWLER